MKSENITNHGMIIDSLNFNGLIKAQANTETFHDKTRRVINVKSKTQSKKLVKIKKSSQRHR